MTNKFINLKRNKKVLFFISILFIGSVIGVYWDHKINNEMIVKFTQLDESDPSFPFGERKIDASPWIKKGYKKIDDYKIYNPNPVPLKTDLDLAVAVGVFVYDNKENYLQLYRDFNKKDALDEFLNKDIKIKYLVSYFNEYSNLPTNDEFLVTFDGYQIEIERKTENGETYLYGYDLKKISSSEQDKQ